ncbi:hypothetical protein WN944_013403 [Citrus x changshan-huyou]|uniref:Translation elongation factor EF1B beta/delta subunit guanine nucleotide exchange domain-containing protein n=1 Tax=Citrus x changshan-huyou TaxID=2935761 RepID=A0AAP0M406_9ROSI
MGIWDLRYRYPDLVRVQGKTLTRTGVRINMQVMPNQKENPLYSKVSKASAPLDILAWVSSSRKLALTLICALVTVTAMAVAFDNVNSATGLKKLDEYLLTRSYITGYQASKDDITVYSALSKAPSSEYVNVSRWYKHIDALLRISGVTGEGSGVTVEGSAPVATPPVADSKASSVLCLFLVYLDDCPYAYNQKNATAAAPDDDDDDVDLFGEETEEEKKAAEARAASVKASAKKKESGKSSVLLDVKPWDDETDMKKLEEAVRSVQMEGLLWGASKLAPVGYGIKKLQIMLTIVDDLVSVDTLIEEHLLEEPINEYVQSCDIVAFNKICKYQYLVFIFHNLLQVIKSSIYCSASFFPHEIPEELYYL